MCFLVCTVLLARETLDVSLLSIRGLLPEKRANVPLLVCEAVRIR